MKAGLIDLTWKFFQGNYKTKNQDHEKCMTLGYGDSGGPLVCKHPQSRKWNIMGVVSNGDFCKYEKITPGVYANVIYFRNWILKFVRGCQ